MPLAVATGARRGIGLEVTRQLAHLAQRGYRVLMTSRRDPSSAWRAPSRPTSLPMRGPCTSRRGWAP